MPKNKTCKGTGKAINFGCGVELPFSENNGIKTYKSKFGLGLECRCYNKWLTNTEEGLKFLSKATLTAKKKVTIEKNREEKARFNKMKIDSISPDRYRARYVQPIINKIARFIDYGNPCVPTGNFEGKMAGGHFTSVGANRTICLNLHNIFIQSFHSNSWKGGDDKKYRASLIRIFGQEYLDFIEGLNSHKSIHLKKEDLIQIKETAQKIALELEKNPQVLSPKERVLKRNEINERLNIYEEGYKSFQWQEN